MRVVVDIDIENARKVLRLSSGNLQEEHLYEKMSEEEIKDTIIRRCKCWGITELKD